MGALPIVPLLRVLEDLVSSNEPNQLPEWGVSNDISHHRGALVLALFLETVLFNGGNVAQCSEHELYWTAVLESCAWGSTCEVVLTILACLKCTPPI